MDEMLTRNSIRFNDWEPAAPLPGTQEKRKAGRHMNGTRNPFMRKYLILIVGAAAFTLYTILLSSWVNYRAGREARETAQSAVRSAVTTAENHIFEVMGISREQFQEMEKAKAEGKPALLTGEESRQAAINDLGEKLAVHAAGLRMDRKVTKAGAETYLWVDAARLLSGKYGSTIDDVLSGPVENYDRNHAVRNEDREIGLKVASAVINGAFPDGFTTDLQFAEINADGSVTARSKLKTDSTTVFWRVSE